MTSLFDPRVGAGLSYLRQPMGGTDFVTTTATTYDDLPAGQTDYEMMGFSIARDQSNGVLPLLQQARAINPRLRVMATPWSPPAWMKTNGSLVGGRLIDDPRIYRAYALYFVKFIQAYAQAGVPVDAVTVQNEPQNRTPAGYPGTDMPVDQQIKLIEALGPALQAAGLTTKILAYDHNWATHPNDLAPGAPADYAAQVLSSAAAPWVAGTSFHCYYGDPTAQTALRNRFPDKGIWLSECSGSHGPSDPPAKAFRDTLGWQARNLLVGALRNWSRTVLTWNVALDPSGGPHVGGCSTCSGLVTVNPDRSVVTNAEYHVLAHASRFVQPGAQRIESSIGSGQPSNVAFRNPDGSIALIVLNDSATASTFAITIGGRSFRYTLGAGALATFTWAA
jgi:glucosylceramidase